MRLTDINRQRLIRAGLFVLLWTILAVLGAIQAYVAQLVFDKPVPWGLAFRRSMKEWYSYGLVTLPVLWFCGRCVLRPGQAGRWFLKHLGAALLFSVGYVVVLSALLAGEVSVQTGEVLTFGYVFRKMAIHYVLVNLMMYWIVVFAHMGWSYYQRYRERELQASELQRQLVEARLSALRMQLNPHFLFNTLHAVSGLIHVNPEGADRVIARLSELLRLSLDQTRPQEVPLREEIGFLDRYLEIEKMRFGDRLTVHKELPPELNNALIPFLILQPLVENAIRHGIEPRESPGELTIRARRQDGQLILCVTDNGPGISAGVGNSFEEGIGLSNTRSRLTHLYGPAATLRLYNRDSGGLEACVEMPYRDAAR